MKRQSSVGTGYVGTCVVRASPRVQVKTQPRVRPRAERVERVKKPKEDGAVWLMRFLACALVLFVLVLLVFQI